MQQEYTTFNCAPVEIDRHQFSIAKRMHSTYTVASYVTTHVPEKVQFMRSLSRIQ